VLGTVKLLGGALFLAIAWALEASLVGHFFGWFWSPLAFATFVGCGYAALRWDEIAAESFEAISMFAFRRKARVSAALTARRLELARQVHDALSEAP
jgi:hypothetical protein